MNSYENEIIDFIEGNTPKEKYDNLVNMARSLSSAEIKLKNLGLLLTELSNAEDDALIKHFRSAIVGYGKAAGVL